MIESVVALKVTMFFPKVTTEFIRYTELSLLAEIGGYLGLLMGYSLLNVTKLFQVSNAKKNQNKLNKLFQSFFFSLFLVGWAVPWPV